jgi:hypothetical protein
MFDMFGGDDRQKTSILHADNPCIGDYWHEMFNPVARVLMVDDQHVLIQDLAGCAGKTIEITDPKPKVMTRRRFAKWLRYDSIPDKTWADVSPRKFAESR